MPEGPHGPHGPFGPGPMWNNSFGPMPLGHMYAHGHYGWQATPGPIQGAKGFANGLPGEGIQNVRIFDSFKNTFKYSIKRNGVLKGVCIGMISFISEPASELRYTVVRNMTNKAYQDKRLSKQQYDYRMIKNEERLLYRNLKVGFINEEVYDKAMDQLENKYNSISR